MNFNEYQEETRRTAPRIEDVLRCLINFSMGLTDKKGGVNKWIK